MSDDNTTGPMTASSPSELGQQIEPLAEQLEALTKPLAGNDALPAAQQLAPVVSDAVRLVGYILRNTSSGQLDSARGNLQILHDLSERLTATTRTAITECSGRLPRLHGHCLATVQLDDAEREWLDFRPYAANEVPADLDCALEAGHPEPHAANAQMGDGVEWWMRWTLRASEIVEVQPCRVETPNTDPDSLEETDICLLYTGHPGRHSFDLGA